MSDGPAHRTRPETGPDRLSVLLLALATTLVVLALFALPMRTPAPIRQARVRMLVRRIVETRVVETVQVTRPLSATAPPAPRVNATPNTATAATQGPLAGDANAPAPAPPTGPAPVVTRASG